MTRFILFSLTFIACSNGPEEMGREIGVLQCNHGKEMLKNLAGNSKQKKSAEKELKKIAKKIEKIEAKIKKLDKKKQKIAVKATETYVSQVCAKGKKKKG